MGFHTQQHPDHPAEGKQFTITMKPPIPAGCTLSIYINDRRALPGGSIGDVKLVGFGVSEKESSVTLEALKDDPQVTIHFLINCPPQTSTYVKHDVGDGWHPAREEREPFNPDKGRELPPDFDEDFPPSLRRHPR